MARPRRIKEPAKGDRVECKERIPGSLTLELFANNQYHGDQVCLCIVEANETQAAFQTTLTELQNLIHEFKKVRGIKRARKVRE